MRAWVPLQDFAYGSYAPQPQPSGYLSLSKRQAGLRRVVSTGLTPARVENLPHAPNHWQLSGSLYPVFGVICRQVERSLLQHDFSHFQRSSARTCPGLQLFRGAFGI